MHSALDIIAGITGSKHADTDQVVVTIGLLRQIERQVAALLTIIWTVIRIFETDTVRALLGRVRKGEKLDG